MSMTCACGKLKNLDDECCFNCKVRSIGFRFIGGGGYTRQAFHDHTIAERRREIEANPNAYPNPQGS